MRWFCSWDRSATNGSLMAVTQPRPPLSVCLSGPQLGGKADSPLQNRSRATGWRCLWSGPPSVSQTWSGLRLSKRIRKRTGGERRPAGIRSASCLLASKNSTRPVRTPSQPLGIRSDQNLICADGELCASCQMESGEDRRRRRTDEKRWQRPAWSSDLTTLGWDLFASNSEMELYNVALISGAVSCCQILTCPPTPPCSQVFAPAQTCLRSSPTLKSRRR